MILLIQPPHGSRCHNRADPAAVRTLAFAPLAPAGRFAYPEIAIPTMKARNSNASNVPIM
jgi:hypothetical protein